MTATTGSVGPRGWSAPRQTLAEVGTRWADWAALARTLSGATRRRLLAEADLVERIVGEREDWAAERLRARLSELRQQVRLSAGRARALPGDLRAESIACIALAAGHGLGKRPYRVQLLAALAMHEGCVVQMAAGEGKTIAVGLAAVLLGWSGSPCHVLTANDYLAQRDAQLMRPLFDLCGVSAGAVVPDSAPEQRAASYGADVAYATAKQVLADFLRDQILLHGAADPVRRRIEALKGHPGGQQPVMRGLWAAIVDEADSVLIDEAVTPLIISAASPDPMMAQAAVQARDIASELAPNRHYEIDRVLRDVRFTDDGEDRLDLLCSRLPAVWHGPLRRKELVSQAIVARDLFERDRHYIVDDGKVVIVDENTGRAMPGRTWSYGMHQAIEAKEGLEISHPSRTMARMSFQDFFRRYHRLCGASGTLQGTRNELWWTYGLATFEVPTRLPSRLRVPRSRHFAGADEKRRALIRRAAELVRGGHPVLVGTRRISDSETLAEALRQEGIDCVVLNAKQHAAEAAIVETAGLPGRLTVATNMAGRGTDIHIAPEVAARGGLHVLMLEPHESARVDWQLFGRAGRQGAPGHAQGFVSAEDDLLRRHTPWFARWMLAAARSSPPLRAAFMPVLCAAAQAAAQWRAWRLRRQLQLRERLLRAQLSFTDDMPAR